MQDTEKQPEEPKAVGKKKKKPLPEKLRRWYLVRFHPRAGVEEDEKVWLQVNGTPVQFTRDKVVPIDHIFKEAVDDAKRPVYSKPKPGTNEPRKLVGFATRFPYTMIREIKETEFLDALARIGRGEELRE